MTLSSSQRASLEQATANYEQFLPLADMYLEGRGIGLDLAGTFRLGVVAEPEIGHEIYEGRLAIPYLTKAGVVNIKFRCLGEHTECDGHAKYLSLNSTTNIYNTKAFFEDSRVIAICEGEIDALVLDSLAGIPSVGIPGVKNWKPHYDRCFHDYERVLMFVDGDEAGRNFHKHVAGLLEYVTPIYMPPGQDVNTVLLLEGPEGLRKRAGL